MATGTQLQTDARAQASKQATLTLVPLCTLPFSLDHSVTCATTGQSSDAVLPTTAHFQEPHLHPIPSTTTNVDDDDIKATTYTQDTDTKGKGRGKGNGVVSDDELESSQPNISGHGRSVTDSINIKAKSSTSGSPVSSSPTRSDLYTSTYSRSSNSSSSTSLSSVEEDDESLDEFKAKPSTGSTSRGTTTRPHGPSASSRHPRVGSSASQYLYPGSSSGSGSGSSSGSGSGSGSGSSSGVKPGLQRASTTPASMFSSSSTSVPPIPVPIVEASKPLTDHDLCLYSYDAIPDDFDFGDLPFYDTDPRTGTIYGDPHAITRPYLVPEAYFDLYRLVHDDDDKRRVNVHNKHGTVIYYHPGRHIGVEQDSIRSPTHGTALWSTAGRTSTWGMFVATETLTKRQIKIVMETNKKKAAGESNEPLARFVFRWKENDFVTEYRKHKDQYRITTYQMCGGDSKWKPPQPKPSQTMFHGLGMEHPGNVNGAFTMGTPSPFDSRRYLQLISEYRLNSGPVQKKGDFELHNPDTFPVEFRSFLVMTSILVLDVMRPVEDKKFIKEFPEVAKQRMASSGTVASGGIRIVPSRMPMPLAPLEGNIDARSTFSLSSSSGSKTPPLAPEAAAKAAPKSAPVGLPRQMTAPPASTTTPAPIKKSRWGSLFKK